MNNDKLKIHPKGMATFIKKQNKKTLFTSFGEINDKKCAHICCPFYKKQERFRTGFKIAVRTGIESRFCFYVYNGCYAHYIFQSSNKNQIDAYGRKDKKDRKI